LLLKRSQRIMFCGGVVILLNDHKSGLRSERDNLNRRIFNEHAARRL
jgi:hypothetical protein